MDQTTLEVRMASWQSIVERCQARPKGQSARQWLVENGIHEKQYYYWLRKIRLQSYNAMKPELPVAARVQPPAGCFTEIPVPDIDVTDPAPAVVIKTKKATIEIAASVQGSLLVQLIKAVGHAL